MRNWHLPILHLLGDTSDNTFILIKSSFSLVGKNKAKQKRNKKTCENDDSMLVFSTILIPIFLGW